MLNVTVLIDKYLLGELTETELREFETQLKTNQELQNDLDLQKIIMKGIERASMLSQLQTAKSQFLLKTVLSKIGLVLLTAAIILISTLLILKNKENSQKQSPEKSGNKLTYQINQNADTLLEMESGMLFFIPAKSFETNNEIINIEVEEALDAASIIMKGLSTMSDSNLLSTAGMFKFNAFVDSIAVKIIKEITVSMPTKKVDPAMMLFEGIEDSLGNINWVNPKTLLPAPLRTFALENLNFFPKGYLDLLEKMYQLKGINAESKRIYFEMSGWQGIPNIQEENNIADIKEILPSDNIKIYIPSYTGKLMDRKAIYFNRSKKGSIILEDSFLSAEGIKTNRIATITNVSDLITNRNMAYIQYDIDLAYFPKGQQPQFVKTFARDIKKRFPETDSAPININTVPSNFEIDPARIKAIWNADYNNTLLATKEFEERLQFIFTTCNQDFLDMYIKHLDKPMYFIDSLCASKASGNQKKIFMDFYSQKKGGVNMANEIHKKLNEHYQKQYKIYKDEAIKVSEKLKDSFERIDRNYQNHRNANTEAAAERKAKLFSEELNKNIENAYKQIGLKTKTEVLSTKPISYTFTINQTGWYNLDKYVMETTLNRTTLEFKDNINGKTAVIAYKEIVIKIKDYSSYDFINVYSVPVELSSYKKIMGNKGAYSESLNTTFNNKIVVVAKRNAQWLYNILNETDKGSYTINLKAIDQVNLKIALGQLEDSKKMEILNDFDFSIFDNNYQQDLRRRNILANQKRQIAQVIFPCSSIDADNSVGGDMFLYLRSQSLRL